MIDSTPYREILTRLHSDGWTDRHIAHAMGYSSTAVNLIRRGVTRKVYPETANRIAALSVFGERLKV